MSGRGGGHQVDKTTLAEAPGKKGPRARRGWGAGRCSGWGGGAQAGARAEAERAPGGQAV